MADLLDTLGGTLSGAVLQAGKPLPFVSAADVARYPVYDTSRAVLGSGAWRAKEAVLEDFRADPLNQAAALASATEILLAPARAIAWNEREANAFVLAHAALVTAWAHSGFPRVDGRIVIAPSGAAPYGGDKVARRIALVVARMCRDIEAAKTLKPGIIYTANVPVSAGSPNPVIVGSRELEIWRHRNVARAPAAGVILGGAAIIVGGITLGFLGARYIDRLPELRAVAAAAKATEARMQIYRETGKLPEASPLEQAVAESQRVQAEGRGLSIAGAFTTVGVLGVLAYAATRAIETVAQRRRERESAPVAA